jgi:thioredoxin 2
MSAPLLIRCPACGSKNRVPRERVSSTSQPVCGKCKAPLAIDFKPIVITAANYAAEVERSPLPVLLDLWAPWCGPCRTIAPAIEQLADEMAGRVRFGKLNVDDHPTTAARFKVDGIPTLVILHAGREVERLVGAHPKSSIAATLERVLARL